MIPVPISLPVVPNFPSFAFTPLSFAFSSYSAFLSPIFLLRDDHLKKTCKYHPKDDSVITKRTACLYTGEIWWSSPWPSVNSATPRHSVPPDERQGQVHSITWDMFLPDTLNSNLKENIRHIPRVEYSTRQLPWVLLKIQCHGKQKQKAREPSQIQRWKGYNNQMQGRKLD